MNQLATALEKAREKVAAKAGKFSADVLTAYSPGDVETRDDAGEPTYTTGIIASDVPCKYEALSTFEQLQGGAAGNTATHRIRMPATAETLTIDSDDQLIVEARGTTPELTFEVVGRLDSSTSVMLEVAATLKG